MRSTTHPSSPPADVSKTRMNRSMHQSVCGSGLKERARTTSESGNPRVSEGLRLTESTLMAMESLMAQTDVIRDKAILLGAGADRRGLKQRSDCLKTSL